LKQQLENGGADSSHSDTLELNVMCPTYLEPDCEDFGQSVKYKGTIEESGTEFILDSGHTFPKDKEISVCGNTYNMLKQTRFASHFEFLGEGQKHVGLFKCGGTSCDPTLPTGKSCCS